MMVVDSARTPIAGNSQAGTDNGDHWSYDGPHRHTAHGAASEHIEALESPHNADGDEDDANHYEDVAAHDEMRASRSACRSNPATTSSTSSMEL